MNSTTISRLEDELVTLRKKASQNSRKTADVHQRMQRLQRRMTTSRSPVQQKPGQRELVRHQKELSKLAQEKADLDKQIASKSQKLTDYQRKREQVLARQAKQRDSVIEQALQQATEAGDVYNIVAGHNYGIVGNNSTLYSFKEEYTMTVFDQRGQHVTYQYNAAGDINFGAVQNRIDVIAELEKLKAEVVQARDTGVLPKKDATTIEYQITQAVNEAEEPQPNKQTMLEHINGAKVLIEGIGSATGLVRGFVEAAEMIQRFFG